jgi:hypothetical protein
MAEGISVGVRREDKPFEALIVTPLKIFMTLK